MKSTSYKIVATAEELNEGLFGQIVLHVFEILPYLYARSIFPAWDIKSKLYGIAPHFTVIPGAFDLAYDLPPSDAVKEVRLSALRGAHIRVLGGNWTYAHNLWQAYFKIPGQIVSLADACGDLSNSLGIHYRGTDKNRSWHTNAMAQDTFLMLTEDFLRARPEVASVLVATDEPSFIARATERLTPIAIVNLGEVEFHKKSLNDPEKVRRALLDCVLLSRCRYVLKGSSALSGFSKILNPQLEIFRVSASKLFADIPYFPEAYIPRLTSMDAKCTELLESQFRGDWLDNDDARQKFDRSFSTMPRYGVLETLKRRIAHRI